MNSLKRILPILLLGQSIYAEPIAAQMPPTITTSQSSLNQSMSVMLPAKKIKVLLSAFRPWTDVGSNQIKETNMADLVAQSISELSRNNPYSKIEVVGTINLDVMYDKSSEELMSRVLALREPPDLILSLGQGTEELTIETGAHGGPSDIPDIAKRTRDAHDFAGFDIQRGFNFPVQDMYCSLAPSDRRLIQISHNPGNFVCNDLSYYMSQFTHGAGYARYSLNQMQTRNEMRLADALRSAEEQKKIALATEEDRLRSTLDQRNKTLKLISEIRARNNEKILAGVAMDKLEVEPLLINDDKTEDIKRMAVWRKQNAESDFQKEATRIQRFRNLFTLENPIPFVFVHLPVSAGIIHKPVYKIENAMCLETGINLPQQDGLLWAELDTAVKALDDNRSSLERTAERIVQKAIDNQKKNPPSKDATQKPTIVNSQIENCLPNNAMVESGSYRDQETDQIVVIYRPAPPKARFVYALSASEGRVETEEKVKKTNLAQLLIKMIEGAVQAQGSHREVSHFPLPTLKNNVTFPRGKEYLKQLRNNIMSLAEPETEVTVLVPNKAFDPKTMVKGVDYTTKIHPALLSKDQASCYKSFIDQVIDDQKLEESNSNKQNRRF